MMTYEQTIDYIYGRMPLFQVVGASAYKPGLDSMRAFDAYLGHPHHQFPTIHVAGTNGKGSVSHTIASVLQSAGYKVGLFTSPHLRDFRERARVNGEMMPKEFVTSFVDRYMQVFDVIYPSFFEVTVAMAFDFFRQQQVDVAVVEVGLGGRLDSTNIINPRLCVITNISFDHTNILGDTLAEIAAEKAGIIKTRIPVVIGEADDPAVRDVFVKKAAEELAPIHFVEEELEVTEVAYSEKENMPVMDFTINGKSFSTSLLGDYQKKNMPTAYLACMQLRRLGFNITNEALQHGFLHAQQQTHLLGRWQQLDNNPLTVCDCGHNEAGLTFVANQLARTKYNCLRFVIGMMKDKDVAHVLPLLPKDAVYYFTQASSPRAMPAAMLQEKAKAFGLEGFAVDNVPDAIKRAKADAKEGDMVFVGGSCYVVAEIPDLE